MVQCSCIILKLRRTWLNLTAVSNQIIGVILYDLVVERLKDTLRQQCIIHCCITFKLALISLYPASNIILAFDMQYFTVVYCFSWIKRMCIQQNIELTSKMLCKIYSMNFCPMLGTARVSFSVSVSFFVWRILVSFEGVFGGSSPVFKGLFVSTWHSTQSGFEKCF